MLINIRGVLVDIHKKIIVVRNSKSEYTNLSKVPKCWVQYHRGVFYGSTLFNIFINDLSYVAPINLYNTCIS